MKIAIPSSGDSSGSLINSSLGHSPYISIYNVDTKKYDFFENIGFRMQDGSGLKAAELLLQNNTDVLLTMEIGQKAYSLLMKKHVNIHLISSQDKLKSIIKNFLKSRE
jgi:predicted Fe-Mo cluster-binding NifX family protein